MSSSYSRSALVYASLTTSTNHRLTCVRWMSSINGSQWSRRWVRPPRILSVSRRYSWSCLTEHNILSNSPGLRWAMPGMRIHWGAWSGNCVFARNPACGNRLTTNWSWTSPRVKRQVDTQSACRNDLLLAVASANKNVVLSVRHFRSMTSSLGLSFAPSVNGGRSKAVRTRWRSHWGINLRWTGRANWKLRSRALRRGSVAGSYFQCRSTDAMEVLWDIIVDGA